MRTPSLRHFKRSEDGSVILETALMMFLLLLLLFGIVDVGRVLFTANNAVSAAREGARRAAVTPSITASGSQTAVKDTVINHFTAYRFGGPALGYADINVEPLPAGSGAPSAVRVTVSYPFTWITPIPRLLGWTGSNTRIVHGQAEYRYEF
jgi:Flp pilus assembly protein TadG